MINVTQEIRDFTGETITLGTEENERPLTLRLACTQALTMLRQQDQGLSGEEKFKRGLLAERIYTNDEIELEAEDISLLKKLIGETFNAIIILRTWRMLDPATKQNDKSI